MGQPLHVVLPQCKMFVLLETLGPYFQAHSQRWCHIQQTPLLPFSTSNVQIKGSGSWDAFVVSWGIWLCNLAIQSLYLRCICLFFPRTGRVLGVEAPNQHTSTIPTAIQDFPALRTPMWQ